MSFPPAFLETHQVLEIRTFLYQLHISYNGDKSIRESVNAIAKKFLGWSEFNTEYVFVNPCGAISEMAVA